MFKIMIAIAQQRPSPNKFVYAVCEPEDHLLGTAIVKLEESEKMLVTVDIQFIVSRNSMLKMEVNERKGSAGRTLLKKIITDFMPEHAEAQLKVTGTPLNDFVEKLYMKFGMEKEGNGQSLMINLSRANLVAYTERICAEASRA